MSHLIYYLCRTNGAKRMRFSVLLYIVLAIFSLASCSSQKKLSGRQAEAARLSSQFGFKITPKDDLRLYSEASRWLGVPYRYGGKSRTGVDCSGLVGQIYQNVYKISLQRTVEGIADKNCRKVAKSDLKTGDLVFFNTSKRKKGMNHVGLFLKDHHFIHASTSKGVIVSNLRESYYRKHWKKGGRVKK